LIDYHIQLNILGLRTDEYTDYILHLIKLILKGNHIINIYSKNDIPINKFNTKVMISNEVIKFLYRHQKFNKLFFIYNSKKFGSSLNEITNKIIGINNMNYNSKVSSSTIVNEPLKSAFFVINKFDKIIKKKENQEKNNFFDDVEINFQYLIISKNRINGVENFEIDIHRKISSSKSNTNISNNSKKNKNKNKYSKYPAKNIIKDNNSHSVDNSNLNNNNSPKNKSYSASKKRRNNDQIEIRHDPISDFTVIDHDSIDLEKTDSSFTESDEDLD
jgi:hypothetical protein